jgi:hypothetical protein
MSRPPYELPERLLEADATSFERRVLEAALRKQPSRAASARMARSVGVTMTAAATVLAMKTVAAGTAATKAAAAAGTSATWSWISTGVLGLAVAGAVVGTRAWRAPPPEPRPLFSPAATSPTPSSVAQPSNVAVVEPASAPVGASRRARTAPGDLRDQIEFIDAARAAVSVGAHRRALEMLRRYQDKYPVGSFRPEATALKVEVLMKVGREAEARALAERFVVEHRGSLLSARVAELAGLGTK